MSSEFILPFSINLLSSLIYDIGKTFVKNGRKPLKEEQLLKIIDSFQKNIDNLNLNQDIFNQRLDCLEKQNEDILKLLLMIFDKNNMISFSYSKKGYLLDGSYTLSNLNQKAVDCINNYTISLPQATPKTLSQATWPIPNKIKGELLDEIQKNLYNE